MSRTSLRSFDETSPQDFEEAFASDCEEFGGDARIVDDGVVCYLRGDDYMKIKEVDEYGAIVEGTVTANGHTATFERGIESTELILPEDSHLHDSPTLQVGAVGPYDLGMGITVGHIDDVYNYSP